MSKVLRSYRVFSKPYIINAMEEMGNCVSVTDNDIEFKTDNVNALNTVNALQEIVIKKAEETIKSANKKYEEIIKKAKEEADMIIKNALNESESIKLAAQQEGFEIGKKMGYEEAMKKMQTEIMEAQKLKNWIIEEKEKIYKTIESDIINLVITSVQKILKTAIEIDQEYLINVISDAVKKSIYNQYLKIRISEDDFDFVANNKIKILTLVEGLKDIEIEKDLSLEKGDIIIETPAGWIDCTLITQIERLKEIFKGVMKNG